MRWRIKAVHEATVPKQESADLRQPTSTCRRKVSVLDGMALRLVVDIDVTAPRWSWIRRVAALLCDSSTAVLLLDLFATDA